MNKELLLKVKERILAEPHLFQMPTVFQKTDCGTACCIYGHALVETRGVEIIEDFFSADYPDAGELFEILDELVEVLIYSHLWAEPFRTEFFAAEGNKQLQAEIAARYIDWFIENGEAYFREEDEQDHPQHPWPEESES